MCTADGKNETSCYLTKREKNTHLFCFVLFFVCFSIDCTDWVDAAVELALARQAVEKAAMFFMYTNVARVRLVM